jgi:hypothetical protein
VFDKEEPAASEGVRQEQQEEPDSRKETAPPRDATGESGQPPGAGDTVGSKVDDDTKGDDPSSTPGKGEDGDVAMTQGEDDGNAKQKDAVEVISSDEDSGKSEQEDSAMTEDSDAHDGPGRTGDQEEGGDIVMADAPVKEGSTTKEADNSRPELEET